MSKAKMWDWHSSAFGLCLGVEYKDKHFISIHIDVPKSDYTGDGYHRKEAQRIRKELAEVLLEILDEAGL